MSVDGLKITILNEDVAMLSTSKGVGKKTAQKIILELKDKIPLDKDSFVRSDFNIDIKKSDDNNKKSIILDALVNLGFMKNDIEKFLSTIDIEKMEIEDIIKLSMKKL